jgi:hypothetical protein
MMTQSEIDAIHSDADFYAEKVAFRVPYDGSNKFYDDDHYKWAKETAIHFLTQERQRTKVMQAGFMAAIDVIKQWHNADEVWDIYFNNAPEMKPIREALNTYNKNKP